MLAVGLALGADAAAGHGRGGRRRARAHRLTGRRRRAFAQRTSVGLACDGAAHRDPRDYRSSSSSGRWSGLAPARRLGAPRGGDPGRRAARSTTSSRPGTSSTRPTTTSTSSRRGRTPGLGYHPDWAAEDPRYVPQNLAIMLLSTPRCSRTGSRTRSARSIDRCAPRRARREAFRPRLSGRAAARHRDERPPHEPGATCSRSRHGATAGTRRDRRRRPARGRASSRASNLMHFSQGWVQFGYRFSNDCRRRSRWCSSRSGSPASRRAGPGRCRSRGPHRRCRSRSTCGA